MISKACKKNCLFCKDFFYVLYFDVKEKILPPLLHQYPKKSWTFYVPPPPSPQPPIINIELRPSTTRIGRHKTHSHTHTHARTHARTHTYGALAYILTEDRFQGQARAVSRRQNKTKTHHIKKKNSDFRFILSTAKKKVRAIVARISIKVEFAAKVVFQERERERGSSRQLQISVS